MEIIQIFLVTLWFLWELCNWVKCQLRGHHSVYTPGGITKSSTFCLACFCIYFFYLLFAKSVPIPNIVSSFPNILNPNKQNKWLRILLSRPVYMAVVQNTGKYLHCCHTICLKGDQIELLYKVNLGLPGCMWCWCWSCGHESSRIVFTLF